MNSRTAGVFTRLMDFSTFPKRFLAKHTYFPKSDSFKPFKKRMWSLSTLRKWMCSVECRLCPFLSQTTLAVGFALTVHFSSVFISLSELTMNFSILTIGLSVKMLWWSVHKIASSVFVSSDLTMLYNAMFRKFYCMLQVHCSEKCTKGAISAEEF